MGAPEQDDKLIVIEEVAQQFVVELVANVWRAISEAATAGQGRGGELPEPQMRGLDASVAMNQISAAAPLQDCATPALPNAATPNLVAALAARSFLHNIVLSCILQKRYVQPAAQNRELIEQEQRKESNNEGSSGGNDTRASSKDLRSVQRSRSKVLVADAVPLRNSDRGRRPSLQEGQRSSLYAQPKSGKRYGRASIAVVSTVAGRTSPCASPRPGGVTATSSTARKAGAANSWKRSASLSVGKVEQPSEFATVNAISAPGSNCSPAPGEDSASTGVLIAEFATDVATTIANVVEEIEPSPYQSEEHGVVGDACLYPNPYDARHPLTQFAAIGGQLSLSFDMSQIKEDEFGGLCLEAEIPHHMAGLFGYTAPAIAPSHGQHQFCSSHVAPWETNTAGTNSHRLSIAAIDRHSPMCPSDHGEDVSEFTGVSPVDPAAFIGNPSYVGEDLQNMFGKVHGVDVYDMAADKETSSHAKLVENVAHIPRKPAGRPSPKKPARRVEGVSASGEKVEAGRPAAQFAQQQHSRFAASSTKQGKDGGDADKRADTADASRAIERHSISGVPKPSPRNVEEAGVETASNDGVDDALAGVQSSDQNGGRSAATKRRNAPQLHMKILDEDLYIYRGLDSPCESPTTSAAHTTIPSKSRTFSELESLAADAQTGNSPLEKDMLEPGFPLEEEGVVDGTENYLGASFDQRDAEQYAYEVFNRDNLEKLNRSARLLAQLGTRMPLCGSAGGGSPMKKSTAGSRSLLKNSDSARTMGTMTTNPSYRTLTTDPSCRTLTTDPSYRTLTSTATSGGAVGSTCPVPDSSPVNAAEAKEMRRRAMRERQWNSAFNSPVRGNDELEMLALSMQDIPLPRGRPPTGQNTGADVLEAGASISSLPRPLWQCRGLWPSTAPTVTSKGGARKAAANMMSLEAPLLDVQSWRQSGLADQVEWYGSPLHAAYLQNVDAQARYGNGDSRTVLAAALEGPHSELRALAQDPRVCEDPESDDRGDPLARGHSLLRVLWEELQVPKAARTGPWMHPQQMLDPAEALILLAEHAKALLSYRDATMLVIHGLVEHERLFAEVQQADDILEDDDPLLTQLRQIDGACVQFLVTWARRFPDPPWLTGDASKLPPIDLGRRRIFLWRGLDALAGVRADAASAHPTRSPKNQLSPLSARQLGSGRGFEVAANAVSASPPRRRVKGPENCSGRAALNDSRGLRALLRGSGPGRVASTGDRRVDGWGPTALRPPDITAGH